MGVSKVSFNTVEGEQTLIDLTNDTVKEEDVFNGAIFHGADGEQKTGTFTLAEEMTEQDALIAQIQTALQGKAAGGGSTEPIIEALEITENGTYAPPSGVDGYSPVTVNVPIPDGYIVPSGTLDVTENGTHDVTKYVSVNVNVASSGGAGESGIPSGYMRCDYILFDGKQLVDTGIIGNQNTQVNTYFTWESTTQRHLFGCASSDNTASITSYMNGSWRFGNKNSSKSFNNKNPMLSYCVIVNNTTISTSNSITNISDVNDFETVGTLLLGGCRNGDGSLPTVYFTGKVISYFSLWQSGELVLKLIPVTDGNGVYRFWDKVSGNFFDSITSTPLNGGNF